MKKRLTLTFMSVRLKPLDFSDSQADRNSGRHVGEHRTQTHGLRRMYRVTVVCESIPT